MSTATTPAALPAEPTRSGATTLRSGRLVSPELPTGRLELQPPPRIERTEGAGGVPMNAIPMLGSLGAIVLVATTAGKDTGGRQYATAGMFLFATIGFVVVQLDRQRTQRGQQVTRTRRDYLHYLGHVRQAARAAADQQRVALTWRHPDPAALPSLADEGSRLWERSSADPGFLHVRYGVSHQPLGLELVPPEHEPVDQVDPVAAWALHRLLVVHRLQPDLPAAVDLRDFQRIEVCGAEEPVRSLARAMICSATAFHSPDHLLVAVLTDDQHLAHWDWLKWLPHGQSTRRYDAVGPMRMVSTSLDELASLLPADLPERPRFGADERPAAPHVLLVLDGVELPPGNHAVPRDGVQGVTVLDLPVRWDELRDPTRLRLQLEGEPLAEGRYGVRALRLREETVPAKVDQCPLPQAEAFARRLTPLHTAAAGGPLESAARGARGDVDFMELLGLGDVRGFDPDQAWRSRPPRDRLRVPIGISDIGALVSLDLKESAQQGMGPHGLVIGATGSGKSELLRTLVLGLAMTHSPEQLNLVLVDFKGGATFGGMSALPHVSAVITNLAQELTLVDRMQDALSGEMVRRQELLREAGNLASVRDYEKARLAGGVDSSGLVPLPSLFIVVDEFSELLAAKPEFIDLFVAIGRLGRSLGLHLLLASQRLEEGRLRGLETHLSYRVGLRTFSAQESRAVLGVPDAYELPAVPGLGYLKPDPTTLVRFKAAYVSGPPAARVRLRRDGGGKRQGILPFTITEVRRLDVDVPEDEPSPTPVETEQDSLLDLAVARMAGHGPAAHQVWLPPLDVPDTLDRLMPDLAADPRLGLVSRRWRDRGALTVPLGTVDRPREQRRDTLSVDLSGSAGHVAVVGGPRSGKSTLLRSIVTGLALTSTPQETQFYVLDFGGGTFASLAELPHVSGVAARSERDVVSRIVAEVQGIVDRREAYFRQLGIDSIETYRVRRARAEDQGRVDDGYGDVFLVIDGWGTLRSDFDDVESAVQQLSTRGLTFGLHVVSAAARWSDFRPAMRDLFGTRLELRLGDPSDSEVDRRSAALVPAGRPGRGLVATKLHFLGALPRIDGDSSAGTLGDGVDDLVAKVRAAWAGPPAPQLRLLPARIDLAAVREQAGPPADRLVIGIDEKDLAPVTLDPAQEPHLLVLGDSGAGKSGVLRTLAQEIMRTRTQARAQILLVDYRRTHLGELPADYLLDHVTSASQATSALREIATYLEGRIPGPDVTPAQLRQRSWWSGAELFVLVDDYDLVATQQGSPVAALQPLLAQARDVGLHLVVARRSGGASRALYEPVVQSLRDLAMPGLMLSGSPDEGPLLGNQRPSLAPPGRGRLVTRDRGVEVIQLAWSEPSP